MSELDFDEIEKAIQKMASADQQKSRIQQLNIRVKKRDELAKQTDARREQGKLATDRIIRSSAINRTTPKPRSVVEGTTFQPTQTNHVQKRAAHSASYGGISDQQYIFSKSPHHEDTALSQVGRPLSITRADHKPLDKPSPTVGELSDSFVLSGIKSEQPSGLDQKSTRIRDDQDVQLAGPKGLDEASRLSDSPITEAPVHATFGHRVPDQYVPPKQRKRGRLDKPTKNEEQSNVSEGLPKKEHKSHSKGRNKVRFWKATSLVLLIAAIACAGLAAYAILA